MNVREEDALFSATLMPTQKTCYFSVLRSHPPVANTTKDASLHDSAPKKCACGIANNDTITKRKNRLLRKKQKMTMPWSPKRNTRSCHC